MAKAYTRGRGFTGNEPNDEIAAVITTASARLAVCGAISQIVSLGAGIVTHHMPPVRRRISSHVLVSLH